MTITFTKIPCSFRPDLAGSGMVLRGPAGQQLASAHLAFAHGRLPNLRPRRWWPSPGQCCSPLHQCRPAVSAPANPFRGSQNPKLPHPRNGLPLPFGGEGWGEGADRNFTAADQSLLAKSFCRRPFRIPSLARGIRRLDLRAQRRVGWVLWPAGAALLRAIRHQLAQAPNVAPLSPRPALVRVRPLVQAHTRHPAARDVVAGLLAAMSLQRFNISTL